MTTFESMKDYMNSLSETELKIIREFNKVKTRFTRHGENIIKKPGRPQKTSSQKKERVRNYHRKKYEEEKAKKIEIGTYRPRGRPKKMEHQIVKL